MAERRISITHTCSPKDEYVSARLTKSVYTRNSYSDRVHAKDTSHSCLAMARVYNGYFWGRDQREGMAWMRLIRRI